MDLTQTATAAATAAAEAADAKKAAAKALAKINDRSRLITLIHDKLGITVTDGDLIPSGVDTTSEYGHWAVVVDGHQLAVLTGRADGFLMKSSPNHQKYVLKLTFIGPTGKFHGVADMNPVVSMADLGKTLATKLRVYAGREYEDDSVYYLNGKTTDYAGNPVKPKKRL